MTRRHRDLTRLMGSMTVALAAVLGGVGCSPAWMTRASDLSRTDLAGAYALAAEAQERETSPQNYMAALVAGTYAVRMGRADLARQHLTIATTDVGSNPAWLRVQAWRMLAYASIQDHIRTNLLGWSGQGAVSVESIDWPTFFRSFIRSLDAFEASCDIAIQCADQVIAISVKDGDIAAAAQDRLLRSGITRLKDNVESAKDLIAIAKANSDRILDDEATDSLLRTALEARIVSIFDAWSALCVDCDQSVD